MTDLDGEKEDEAEQGCLLSFHAFHFVCRRLHPSTILVNHSTASVTSLTFSLSQFFFLSLSLSFFLYYSQCILYYYVDKLLASFSPSSTWSSTGIITHHHGNDHSWCLSSLPHSLYLMSWWWQTAWLIYTLKKWWLKCCHVQKKLLRVDRLVQLWSHSANSMTCQGQS